MSEVRIGTAGWAVPRQTAEAFPSDGSTLERYAARFDAAEINSSFHRSHRPETWERWAASVPPDFRFAVKLPKTITHQQRLVDCDAMLARFAEEIAPLGEKRGPLLVQLPPSLVFDNEVAETFFATASSTLGCDIVCEPRHPSWFAPDADAFLRDLRIARVAADPAPVPEAQQPGGWPGLIYVRLHGSPRTYWSHYDESALRDWAERVGPFVRQGIPTWIIFDNTAGGGAAGNALRFRDLLAE
ncbi:DUF72 domain-containing protein [Sphingomonas tabacisoli]|uniref:DUF72 domain-containing protein n=1 Tax=Sphingomonas tabacisoli TaxID=2249466 RepID=A0ABW4HXL2_9SPHN